MSVLGNQTLLNKDTPVYAPATGLLSVSKTIIPYTEIGGIANGATEVVYNLPVGGQAQLGENLSPGYYIYTANFYISALTWTGTPNGNLVIIVDYQENSVSVSRRIFKTFVNSGDLSNPGVAFSIGIPMVNPGGTGNIAISVLNLTGADINNAYTINMEQFNFEKTTSEVSVVVL